jgi:hypothetical protein
MFKIGDIVYYDWIGYAKKVEIVKCYPKTNRYRVLHEKSYETNEKVSEIFGTENEMWQSKIIKIDNQITSLEKKRDEYKKNIT